jgi:hypothetical protein
VEQGYVSRHLFESDDLSSGRIPSGRKTICGNVFTDVGFIRLQEICLRALIVVVLAVLRDLIRVGFQTRAEIIAENLFLRRQLALYLDWSF